MTKYKQLTLDDRLLIEAGLKEGNSFRTIGMPRKVRMHPRRKSPDTEKVDLRCHEGRAPEDFKVFMAENPGKPCSRARSARMFTSFPASFLLSKRQRRNYISKQKNNYLFHANILSIYP